MKNVMQSRIKELLRAYKDNLLNLSNNPFIFSQSLLENKELILLKVLIPERYDKIYTFSFENKNLLQNVEENKYNYKNISSEILFVNDISLSKQFFLNSFSQTILDPSHEIDVISQSKFPYYPYQMLYMPSMFSNLPQFLDNAYILEKTLNMKYTFDDPNLV